MSKGRTSRKRAIVAKCQRLPDHVEAKLHDLLQYHFLGKPYFAGRAQPNRDCTALWLLLRMGLAECRERIGQPHAWRWRITPLGLAYFREYDRERPRKRMTRTGMLLARVAQSRAMNQYFTTALGSGYDEEMEQLKARGLVSSKLVLSGPKAGRKSWTLTEEGEVTLSSLSH